MSTTGLRRGDAAKLGRQHIGEVNGVTVLQLRTEKGDRQVVREIMPELKAAIDACPAKGLALVARENGSALTKNGFGDWFREACRAAGVSKSPHGLRKHDATALAHSGASEAELRAHWDGRRSMGCLGFIRASATTSSSLLGRWRNSRRPGEKPGIGNIYSQPWGPGWDLGKKQPLESIV